MLLVGDLIDHYSRCDIFQGCPRSIEIRLLVPIIGGSFTQTTVKDSGKRARTPSTLPNIRTHKRDAERHVRHPSERVVRRHLYGATIKPADPSASAGWEAGYCEFSLDIEARSVIGTIVCRLGLVLTPVFTVVAIVHTRKTAMWRRACSSVRCRRYCSAG